MSADNGVYILITQNNQRLEYRVKELFAVDNLYYPGDTINLETLVQEFGDAEVFYNRIDALFAAAAINDLRFYEYGIRFLNEWKVQFPPVYII